MSQVGTSNTDAAPIVVPSPADAAAPPVPAADMSETAPSPPPAAAASTGDNPPEWALNRIDRLTADKRELERQLALAKQGGPSADSGLSSPPVPAVPAVPPAPQFDAAEIDRRANALAEQRLAAQTFEKTVNTIAQNGLKAFPNEWANGVANLQRINALSPEMVSVAEELGNGHEIIMGLAKDMNEAARIASLPTEAARGAALARFAAKIGDSASGTVSRAPAPASTTVGGNQPSTTRSDKDSTDEWIRKRREEKLKARG